MNTRITDVVAGYEEPATTGLCREGAGPAKPDAGRYFERSATTGAWMVKNAALIAPRYSS